MVILNQTFSAQPNKLDGAQKNQEKMKHGGEFLQISTNDTHTFHVYLRSIFTHQISFLGTVLSFSWKEKNIERLDGRSEIF